MFIKLSNISNISCEIILHRAKSDKKVFFFFFFHLDAYSETVVDSVDVDFAGVDSDSVGVGADSAVVGSDCGDAD